MKRIIYLALFLLLAQSGSAQTFNVSEVSDKVSWRVGVGNFSRMQSGDVLSIAYEGGFKIGLNANNFSGNVVIRRYGKDLQEKQASTIPVKDIRTELQHLLNVRMIAKKYYLFYGQKSQDDDGYAIQAILLDSNTLQPVKEITVAKIAKGGDHWAGFMISPNQQAAALWVIIRSKHEEQQFVYQLDENLNVSRTLKGSIGNFGVVINDDGSILSVLGNSHGEEGQRFFIQTWDAGSGLKPKKTEIDFGDKFPVKVNFVYNKTSKNYDLIGLYTENPKRWTGNGVYKADLADVKDNRIKVAFTEMDPAILSLLDKDGFAEDGGKRKGLSREYSVVNTFTREDGSVHMVLEYSSVDNKTIMDSRNQMKSYTKYYSGSLVVVHYLKNGSVVFNRIPKSQEYTNFNAYMHAYSFNVGDKFYFIYNDTKKNVDDPIEHSPSTMSNPKSAVLILASIDENNKVERRQLWDNGDGNYACEPSNCVRLTDGNILMVQSKIGLTNFKYRMAMLEIKK